MCQGSRPAVPHDAAVIENFLKLYGSRPAIFREQIRLTANIGWIEAGSIVEESNQPEFNG
jgi:hypothetical protein